MIKNTTAGSLQGVTQILSSEYALTDSRINTFLETLSVDETVGLIRIINNEAELYKTSHR